MLSLPEPVDLEVSDTDVLVTGSVTLTDRHCKLFFRSVLGATATEDGWRCPRRSTAISTLVVRINGFLEGRNFTVTRHGLAQAEVERDLERRRSYARTRSFATEWKHNPTSVDLTSVKARLKDMGWSLARVLRPHQELGVAHALAAGNAANFSVPGSGKTATALAVAASHLAAGTIDLILVVGPLSCFGPWEDETRIALGEALLTQRIRGSAAARRALYPSLRSGGLYLLSYATAASDRLPLVQLCKAHRVMLIVDESHRIKRFRGGLWAPALVHIATQARVRMILSGTPMPQGGRDLYSQLKVLWPNGELTGSRDSFAVRVDNDLRSILRDINPFLSRVPKSALGLTPYTIHRHDVPLSGTQAEIYDLIFDRFRRRLEDAQTWADKLEALRRARPVRLIQAAANPDLFNRRDSTYHLPKMDATDPTLMNRLASYHESETPAKSEAALSLLSEITDRGGKAVCWSNFVGNLDQFSELVRSRLGIPCFQIDGRVPTGDDALDDQVLTSSPNPADIDTREVIINRFLTTAGAAALVTNPASCSESISLHRGCHNAIYLDRTYDCAQYLQSIDRIHRLGLPEGVVVQIHILRATLYGSETIDHLVDLSLLAKEAAMALVLEGAELGPIAQSVDPADDAEGSPADLAALLRYLLGEEG